MKELKAEKLQKEKKYYFASFLKVWHMHPPPPVSFSHSPSQVCDRQRTKFFLADIPFPRGRECSVCAISFSNVQIQICDLVCISQSANRAHIPQHTIIAWPMCPQYSVRAQSKPYQKRSNITYRLAAMQVVVENTIHDAQMRAKNTRIDIRPHTHTNSGELCVPLCSTSVDNNPESDNWAHTVKWTNGYYSHVSARRLHTYSMSVCVCYHMCARQTVWINTFISQT